MNKIISFGSYPRSEIKNPGIMGPLARLQSKSLKKPFSDHTDITVNDYEFEGVRYRAVSYEDNIIRCFRYEPLTWRVIGESEDRLVLLSNEIIDVCLFNKGIVHKSVPAEGDFYTVNRPKRKANLYYGSWFDKWLNNDLVLKAFDDNERERIFPQPIPQEHEILCSGVYKAGKPKLRPLSAKEFNALQPESFPLTDYAAAFDGIRARVKNEEAGKSAGIELLYNYITPCSAGSFWLMDGRDDYMVMAYDGILVETVSGADTAVHSTAKANELRGVVLCIEIKKQ